MRTKKAVAPEPVVVPVVAVEPAKKKETALKGLVSALTTGLSVGLLLLVVAAGMILIVIPKMTNSIPLTILTTSMEPLLPPGTLVVDQPIKPSQVQVGNIVTYQIAPKKPDVITHRVVAISRDSTGKRYFTFKGDNNAVPDAEKVVDGQIKGRLLYSVPWIGVVSLWMNGPARAIIVPIAAGGLFLFAAWMFIGGAVEKARKRKRAEIHELAA